MVTSVTHALIHYGYAAVFLLVMLEDFGLPTPGETALIVAAGAAAEGKLNIWLVLLAAVAGAVIGDNIGYAIGHFGGRALVVRWGEKLGFGPAAYERAESTFRRHGPLAVAGARFVEVLRQLNGIIAGTLGMHWAEFLGYNALGAALWVGVWGAVGYFAGHNFRAIEAAFARFSWLALAVLLAGGGIWLWRRQRGRAAERE